MITKFNFFFLEIIFNNLLSVSVINEMCIPEIANK